MPLFVQCCKVMRTFARKIFTVGNFAGICRKKVTGTPADLTSQHHINDAFAACLV